MSTRTISSQLINLFTGLTATNKTSEHVSALSEYGICIFYHIIKNPDLNPLQIVRYEIVPGQIQFGGSFYHQVSNRSRIYNASIPPFQLSDASYKYGPEVQVRLVVEETLTSKVLEASF